MFIELRTTRTTVFTSVVSGIGRSLRLAAIRDSEWIKDYAFELEVRDIKKCQQ